MVKDAIGVNAKGELDIYKSVDDIPPAVIRVVSEDGTEEFMDIDGNVIAQDDDLNAEEGENVDEKDPFLDMDMSDEDDDRSDGEVQ